MCGRYQFVLSPAEFAALRLAEGARQPGPRYNVAPTQEVFTFIERERQVRTMIWGFAREQRLLINARAETVHRLPAFRGAFERHRCLVPASGYYEWQGKIAGKKQPWLIRRAEAAGTPLAFAGIWEERHAPAPSQRTVACMVILTVAAAPALEKIHDRMPLWLPENVWDEWLDGDQRIPHARLDAWREAATRDEMSVTPVSQRLNSAKHEDPACAEPVNLDAANETDDEPSLF